MDLVIPPVRLSAPPVAVVPAGPAPVGPKDFIAPFAVFTAIGIVLWLIGSHDAKAEEEAAKNPPRGIQTKEDFQRYLES